MANSSIYRTAINKPVTTLLVFVAVVVIGIFSIQKLPIDMFPQMDPPYITIMTTYQGANASEIETNVTKVIENAVNALDGLDEMTSSSKDNISTVTLKLNWGSDMGEAVNDVRSYLELYESLLPDGCSTPNIFKFNTSMMPILRYGFMAKESYAGLDKIINDDVVPKLNRVNGIGNITVTGAPNRYIYVDINQEKLDAYGIPLETVGNAISNNNINLSSGTVKMGVDQYQMEVRSQYIQSSEINDIVVTTLPTGQKVFVKDIANVRDTIKDITLDEKLNGKESVGLMVSKQSGANTVAICREVKKEMAKIEKILPADIDVVLVSDSSDNIKGSINSLEESIAYALLFVVLVVFFFLGDWRSTLIISLTIPIALIVAFIYLAVTGSSLNIISLSSLTVAIGMVVDDAIVVLENITKHIERGASPREAAIYATNEVWVSVIATTLVIVAVFVPLTMLNGMAGIMFKQLGWIVTIVVSTSTLVAISLTPMLASKILKEEKIKIDSNGNIVEVKKTGWYQKYIVSSFDKIDALYSKSLNWVLHHKILTISMSVIFFIASLIPYGIGKIGTDFMQNSDNDQLSVTVELQAGTRIDETLKTARQLEKRFFTIAPGVLRINTTAGSDDEGNVGSIFSSTNNSKISMSVVCKKKSKRKRSIFEIAEVLRQEMSKYPEIIDYQCEISSEFGPGGASTVDVEIYGYDFNQTNIFAEEVQNLIKDNVKGARDVTISREKDRPELKITVDKEKASELGLNASMISSYVRNRVNGMLSGYLKEDGSEYDIYVRLVEEDRNTLDKLKNLTIPTPSGKLMKLAELATIGENWEPPTIERKSRQRVVTVKVTPYKVSLGELATQIQNIMSDVTIPNGMNTALAGTYEDQQETFADLGSLLLLIILLVYIVMASQFESFKKPGIIMAAVPFALSGVVLSLWITGISLDMIGALGMIMLVGIVVKNGIVLVDYINLMRDRGHELNEAIEIAGKSRLRPVLMTAMTTILGMLPMALSTGEGAELWRPMGVVVMGGLIVSTFVTMFVVPTLYGFMSRHGERDKEKENRKKFIFMKIATSKDDIYQYDTNDYKKLN